MNIEIPHKYKELIPELLLKQREIVLASKNKAYHNTIFPSGVNIRNPYEFNRNRIVTIIDNDLFDDFTILDKKEKVIYTDNGTKRKFIKCKEYGDINNSYKRYNNVNSPIDYNTDAKTFINLDNIRKELFKKEEIRNLNFANNELVNISEKANNLPQLRDSKNKFNRFNDRTTIEHVLKWAKEQGIIYIYAILEHRPYIFNKKYTSNFAYYTVLGSNGEINERVANKDIIKPHLASHIYIKEDIAYLNDLLSEEQTNEIKNGKCRYLTDEYGNYVKDNNGNYIMIGKCE